MWLTHVAYSNFKKYVIETQFSILSYSYSKFSTQLKTTTGTTTVNYLTATTSISILAPTAKPEAANVVLAGFFGK